MCALKCPAPQSRYSLQVEGSTDAGAAVTGRVLDVNKKDGIVDLSLLARLLAAKKAKATKAPADLVVRPHSYSYSLSLVPGANSSRRICGWSSRIIVDAHPISMQLAGSSACQIGMYGTVGFKC